MKAAYMEANMDPTDPSHTVPSLTYRLCISYWKDPSAISL